MYKNVVEFSQGSQKKVGRNFNEVTNKAIVGGVNQANLLKEQRVNDEEKLRQLIESNMGKKVLEEWKIEVLYGWSKTLSRNTYAIKLTNKFVPESITYYKHDIQNMKTADEKVKNLSVFGQIERNYIRFFGNYIDIVRRLPAKLIGVEDISSIVSEPNSELGFSVKEYYNFFLKDYFNNSEKYPTRSSNQYLKNISNGVILDSDNHEYIKNEDGYYPVAIRSGKLKKLFPFICDREYRQVIKRFSDLKVLHESISFKVEIDAKRFDRRIKMVDMQIVNNDKNYIESVYILKIIPSLLERSN